MLGESSRTQPTLRLLMLLSQPLIDPKGQPVVQLRLEQEQEQIQDLLRTSGTALDVCFAPATTANLQRFVLEGYNVVHFSGHGENRVLWFEDEFGRVQEVASDLLRRLILRGGQCGVDLVVLNGCYSESLADAVIAAGVPYVVTIEANEELLDASAIAFSRGFYLALANGLTVESAFQAGKDAVIADPHTTADAARVRGSVLWEEGKYRLLPREDPDPTRSQPLVQKTKRCSHNLEKLEKSVDRFTTWCCRDCAYCEHLIEPDISFRPIADFVGQQEKIVEVNEWLLGDRKRRWVTIKGSGGIGKTELAKAIGWWYCQRGNFPDGIYFVELENATKAAAIHSAIVQALHLSQDRDLFTHLRNQRPLIIMDNAETPLHSDPRSHEMFRKLLETDAQFLVTSRDIVVQGEQRVRLEGLSWKDARTLFLNYAEKSGYQMRADEEPSLNEVLDFLDGMPCHRACSKPTGPRERRLGRFAEKLAEGRTRNAKRPTLFRRRTRPTVQCGFLCTVVLSVS